SAAQPGCEARDARPCDAPERRLAPALRMDAAKTFGGSLDDGASSNSLTSVDQLAGRQRKRPTRRVPRLTSVESEPGGVADRDGLRRDRSALVAVQSRGTKVRDQRQRAVADRRRAETDEHVAGAQIETAFEDGRDLGMRILPAKFARQDARPHNRDNV